MRTQAADNHKQLCRLLWLFAIVLAASSLAMAQSSTITARTPGTPAGSYKLGDADAVNMFTGNLNYHLPLLEVGGRGEARTSLGIVIEAQVDYREVEIPEPQGTLQHQYSLKFPNPLAFVGMVNFDYPSFQTNQSCGNGFYWTTFRPSMTYVEADGTEHALRDVNYHGNVINSCGPSGQPVGQVFQSTSGDFITFVNDNTLYTSCTFVSGCNNVATGYLYFRNGTKSRVEGGLIKWTRDRNGNKITYTYVNNRLQAVTDSLERSVNIEYDVNLSAPYGRCTRLSYKGFDNQDRVLLISHSDLESLLRATRTWDSIREPIEADDPNDNIIIGGGTSDAPDWIKAVWLPNGQSYQFKYNIFGQLARVDLPTGGAIEYDFADLFNIPFPAGIPSVLGPVTNQVSEKRVYGTNGALLSKTKFSKPSSYTQGVIPSGRGGTVRDVELFDPDGNLLGKSRHYLYGTPSADYGLLVPWWHAKEFRTETFDTDGTTILRANETVWAQRIPTWCSGFPFCSSNPAERSPTNNPFIVESISTLADGNLVSKISALDPSGQPAFDSYNNQTDSWVYGYGSGQPGALVEHTQTSYINRDNLTNGIYLLGLSDTTSVFAVNSSGQQTLASASDIDYDEYSQYPLLTYSTVTGWQDPGSVRGNPTTVKRWLNTDNSWIATHAQFDQLGNSRKSWDPLGRMSETHFEDAFSDNIDHHTFGFPTQTVSPIPDSSNTYGSNLALTSTAVYDYYSGLIKTSTDITGQTTTFEYNDPEHPDPLDRLKKVTNPSGGGWSSFYYSDTPGDLYVKTTTTLDQSRNLESYIYFDGLGRTVRSFAPKGGGTWIVGDTKYDAAGRLWKVSKPYEVNTLNADVNPSDNWVTTKYDALGRVTDVTTADGSNVHTDYDGNTVTVSDADLKKRKTESDALGRLSRTIEDPGSGGLNLVTDYTYDTLGNLRKVEQGQQQRFFMYDSLSRLVRSFNPEQTTNSAFDLQDEVTGRQSWTSQIDYLANGDISSRTDARGIRVDYSYDNLNRLYQRSYTATQTQPSGAYTATPTVNTYYDGRGIGLSSIPATFLGRVSRVSSSVGETRYTEFDAMGRIKSSEQIVDGVTYWMPSYNYNLAGGLESQVYPSGRTVTNTYDDGGKLSVVSGQLPNQSAKTYASNFDYSLTSTGATSQMQLGNGRWESIVYNKRLQPVQMGLGTAQNATDLMKLEYSYGTTNNNGNLRSQTITVPASGSSAAFTAVQSYGYDSLNRLTSATETTGSQTSWQQTFDYDQWGNRHVVTGSTTSSLIGDNPTISTSTNRITAQSGEYYDYDAAGNLKVDRVNNKYSFDGENRQAEFAYNGSSSPSAQYFYDGEGNRVKKVVGNDTTVFVYDAFGKLVAEYESNPEPAQGTNYLTTDNLGTPRVTSDSSGNVLSRHDYLPFGEDIGGYGGRANHAQYHVDSVRQKYTGLQRDEENGLDYAEARYYASSSGRFTSADPLMASASTTSPQTFNRYTYALNNPYKYTDPSGMASDESDDMEAAFGQLNNLADWSVAMQEAQRSADREAARKQREQQSHSAAPMHQQTGPGNDQQGEAPQHHSVNSGEPAHSDSTFDPGEHVDVDPQNSTNLRDLTYLIKGARDVVANASGECAKLLGKDALEKFDRISKNIEFNGNVEVQDANPLTGEVERAPLQNLGWVQGETFGNNIYLNPEGTAFNFVHKGGSTQHILQGYFDKLGVTQEQYAFAVVIHEFLHAIKKFGPDATFVSDGNFWKLNGDKSVKNQEEVIRKCFSNKK